MNLVTLLPSRFKSCCVGVRRSLGSGVLGTPTASRRSNTVGDSKSPPLPALSPACSSGLSLLDAVDEPGR